jgi:hypothetical protein
MVDVAQLVEHQIVALVVVGSIPTIHPNLRPAHPDTSSGSVVNALLALRSFNKAESKDGWLRQLFKGLTLKYY